MERASALAADAASSARVARARASPRALPAWASSESWSLTRRLSEPSSCSTRLLFVVVCLFSGGGFANSASLANVGERQKKAAGKRPQK